MVIRIKYGKTQEGRFLSHLDLMRTMERAFRRAGLPLAFSEGFNPHPKVSFASALAVGVTSEGEYLDVELQEEISIEEIKARLSEALPAGLVVLGIKEVRERKKSLTALINIARYNIRVPLEDSVKDEEIFEAIEQLRQASEIYVTRSGKRGTRQVDIKQGIFRIEGKIDNSNLELHADLQTGSEGNVKPAEVLAALERQGRLFSGKQPRIHRVGLFIVERGEVMTPMEC